MNNKRRNTDSIDALGELVKPTKEILEAAENRQRRREVQRAQLWNALDRELAGQLVSMWEKISNFRQSVTKNLSCHDKVQEGTGIPEDKSATSMPERPRRLLLQNIRKKETRPDDLELLKQQVESWSLQALVLTERPRALWRYDLPLLTCLYRALNVPDWAAKAHQHGNFRAVSDLDFRFVFYGGLSWSMAQMETLRRWLDNELEAAEAPKPPALQDLHKKLINNGIRVGMDADSVDKALKDLGVTNSTAVS